jgi:shikimate kinase
MQGKGPEKSARTRGLSSKLHRTVALVGMMGSGKTAVGSEVARRLGVPFLDSDREIERAANATIAEIFARDGEPFFRERETAVLHRLLHGTPCILSTGGGAFLAEANRAMIDADGVALWLDADVDLLWSRVKHKTTRPLLMTDNPRRTLGEIFERRVPIYALAGLRVAVRPGASIAETAAQVIDVLKSRPDVVSDDGTTEDS